MNRTSVHHVDNVLNQFNAFYRFRMKPKHFHSCHSRSEVSFLSSLFSKYSSHKLNKLTSIFHADNVLNQPNSSYWFYMKQLIYFLSYHTSFEVSIESFDCTLDAFLMLWRRMRPTAIVFFPFLSEHRQGTFTIHILTEPKGTLY